MKRQYIIPEIKMLLSGMLMNENLGGLNGTMGDEDGQLSGEAFSTSRKSLCPPTTMCGTTKDRLLP